jgi:hypothetical protein
MHNVVYYNISFRLTRFPYFTMTQNNQFYVGRIQANR